MLDLAAEMPEDALEMIQECGRDVTLLVQCPDTVVDPDKKWKGRGRQQRTPHTVRMAFVTQERLRKVEGTRTLRRERVGYIAALDPGLRGAVPTPRDLVRDATPCDPGNCKTYSIEEVNDWALTSGVVFVLTLVRQ